MAVGLLQLPLEVLQQILGLLPAQALLPTTATCRTLHRAVSPKTIKLHKDLLAANRFLDCRQEKLEPFLAKLLEHPEIGWYIRHVECSPLWEGYEDSIAEDRRAIVSEEQDQQDGELWACTYRFLNSSTPKAQAEPIQLGGPRVSRLRLFIDAVENSPHIPAERRQSWRDRLRLRYMMAWNSNIRSDDVLIALLLFNLPMLSTLDIGPDQLGVPFGEEYDYQDNYDYFRELRYFSKPEAREAVACVPQIFKWLKQAPANHLPYLSRLKRVKLHNSAHKYFRNDFLEEIASLPAMKSLLTRNFKCCCLPFQGQCLYCQTDIYRVRKGTPRQDVLPYGKFHSYEEIPDVESPRKIANIRNICGLTSLVFKGISITPRHVTRILERCGVNTLRQFEATSINPISLRRAVLLRS